MSISWIWLPGWNTTKHDKTDDWCPGETPPSMTRQTTGWWMMHIFSTWCQKHHCVSQLWSLIHQPIKTNYTLTSLRHHERQWHTTSNKSYSFRLIWRRSAKQRIKRTCTTWPFHADRCLWSLVRSSWRPCKHTCTSHHAQKKDIRSKMLAT